MIDHRTIDDEAWRWIAADADENQSAYQLQLAGLKVLAKAIGCTVDELLEHREELRAMNERLEW